MSHWHEPPKYGEENPLIKAGFKQCVQKRVVPIFNLAWGPLPMLSAPTHALDVGMEKEMGITNRG